MTVNTRCPCYQVASQVGAVSLGVLIYLFLPRLHWLRILHITVNEQYIDIIREYYIHRLNLVLENYKRKYCYTLNY